jgi:hypothetical protein
MKRALVLAVLALTAGIASARAEDTFSVAPQQAVSIGGDHGDTFAVEQISRADNNVVVLMRPKGEDCTFRFTVNPGTALQLRTETLDGQTFLCKATLRPIVDDGTAQFAAECSERATEEALRCPPVKDAAHATPPQTAAAP